MNKVSIHPGALQRKLMFSLQGKKNQKQKPKQQDPMFLQVKLIDKK